MAECYSRQVLFDYLQQELPPDRLVPIEAHLPHCVSCQRQLHSLQEQIRRVKITLAQMDSPNACAESPWDSSQKAAASRRLYLHRPAWALAVLLIFAIAITLIVRNGGRQSPDLEGGAITAAYPISGEAYWPEDAQRDWNDQNVTIQVMDGQNRTLEIMRTSLRNDKAIQSGLNSTATGFQ